MCPIWSKRMVGLANSSLVQKESERACVALLSLRPRLSPSPCPSLSPVRVHRNKISERAFAGNFLWPPFPRTRFPSFLSAEENLQKASVKSLSLPSPSALPLGLDCYFRVSDAVMPDGRRRPRRCLRRGESKGGLSSRVFGKEPQKLCKARTFPPKTG